MLRSTAFRSVSLGLVAATGVLATTFASTASAGETTYAPPPNYGPAPTYAPPPNYGPAPTYAPPPNYGPAPAPTYAAPPPQQYYGPGQPTYAPPPPPSYGYNYNPNAMDIGRPGGTIAGVLGFGGYGSSGFGLGVEGGYSLPSHVYIGGNFTYFADTFGAYLFEVQGGYDLAVIPRAPVLIRPYAGLGYEHISFTSCGTPTLSLTCSSAGGGSFLISLGAVGSYFFTRNWFAGVDLRVDIVTATGGYTSFDGFAMGGYKF